MLERTLRKCCFLLADKHLHELPDEAIIGNSPSNYGNEKVTDEHKLFMWNALVDHYESLPETSIYQLYSRHVLQGEPIVKSYAYGEVSPELEELLDTITEAVWGTAQSLPPVRLKINENTD